MYGKVEYDPMLDAFKCEECGEWFSGLSHHVAARHKMKILDYKRKWGLNKNTPLVSFYERTLCRERNAKTETLKKYNASDAHKKTCFQKGNVYGTKQYRKAPVSAEKMAFLKGELWKLGIKKRKENQKMREKLAQEQLTNEKK